MENIKEQPTGGALDQAPTDDKQSAQPVQRSTDGPISRDQAKQELRQKQRSKAGQPSNAVRGEKTHVAGETKPEQAAKPQDGKSQNAASAGEDETQSETVPLGVLKRERERLQKRAEKGWTKAEQLELQLRQRDKLIELMRREATTPVSNDPRDVEIRSLKYQSEVDKYMAELPNQVKTEFAQQTADVLRDDEISNIIFDVDEALKSYQQHEGWARLLDWGVSPRVPVMERMAKSGESALVAAKAIFDSITTAQKSVAPKSVRRSSGSDHGFASTGNLRDDLKAELRAKYGDD